MSDRALLDELINLFSTYSFDCECKRCVAIRQRVHEIRQQIAHTCPTCKHQIESFANPFNSPCLSCIDKKNWQPREVSHE